MTLSNKELYEVRIPCVSSRWVGPDITMADPYLPSLPHMIVMYGGTPLSTSENASAIQKLRLKGHSTIRRTAKHDGNTEDYMYTELAITNIQSSLEQYLVQYIQYSAVHGSRGGTMHRFCPRIVVS